MSPERARKITILVRCLQVTAALGLFIGVVSARVIVAGEKEIAASTEALRAGNPTEAVVRARRAAGWYAPGAPHVRVAYERLTALATRAEGLGDRDLALLGWRAVRSASLETRWLLTPHAGDLERANQAIARLEAAAPRPPGTRTDPPSEVERRQLAALLRDESPRVPWIVGLVLSFSAWVAGAVWFARRGVGRTGELELGRAKAAILLIVVGIAGWLVSIWRA
jgi:hypothetical protein